MKGGKGGGGGGQTAQQAELTDTMTRLAQHQAQLGEQLLREETPMRQAALNLRQRLIGQGFSDLQAAPVAAAEKVSPVAPITLSSLTSSPIYGALKQGAEAQFGRAREETMAGTPRGGALTSLLARLQGERAAALTQGLGSLGQVEQQRRDVTSQLEQQRRDVEVASQRQIRENALNRAMSLASGQPAPTANLFQGASSGLGNVLSTQAAAAQAEAQRSAGKSQGLGSGLGQIGLATAQAYSGGSSSKCWVARAVYGAQSPRWMVFRLWLETRAPRALDRLYGRHGAAFARWLGRHPWAKPTVRRLMDRQIH